MVRVEMPSSCAASDLSPLVWRSVSRIRRRSISSSGVPIGNVSALGAARRRLHDGVGQVVGRQRVAAAEHDRALDHVLELAHVARPRVVAEPLQHVARRPRGARPLFFAQ